MPSDTVKKTLRDADITTAPVHGRRGFLGLMAAGGVAGAAAALAPGSASAQSTDGDNGNYRDGAGCPRGPGGARTGLTDADSGQITDRSGNGRGAPRC